MIAWWRELLERRDLLFMIAWRDIRIKYKQSVMGFLWAILMPLFIVGAGIVVRGGMAIVSGQPLRMDEIAVVTVRSVPWAFIVASLRFATTSLTSNANLVTKIYFPREVFPLAAVASQLVDLLVACVPLVVILVIAGIPASPALLWVPVAGAMMVLLVAGLGVLLSAASLFFRDVKYLVEVFLTFAIFFTPVFWDVSMFGRFARVLLLNPFAVLLETLSDAIVMHHGPAPSWFLYGAAWAVGSFVVGMVTFKKLEPAFAESI